MHVLLAVVSFVCQLSWHTKLIHHLPCLGYCIQRFCGHQFLTQHDR